MNELIVSIYDGYCNINVAFNGEIKELDKKTRDKIGGCSWMDDKKLAEFCKEYNIQRLIICEDGNIVIRNYKEVE